MSRINVGKVSPIPKGNWVQTNSYEKLNMVNKSGVLYIAKQDVPANTAITNENYWMKATSSLSIGTVNTVAYDTPASATITEGENSPILNLNLPRGASGGEIIDDSAQSTDRVWSANKVNNTLLDKLDVDNTTISGDIVTFESERVEPIKDLKVINIEPVQDLHGYDNPWPAGGGKNLCYIEDFTTTVNGLTFTAVDNILTINGTSTGSIGANNAVWKHIRFNILVEGSYARSVAESLPSGFNMASYALSDNTPYASVVSTYPIGEYYIGIYIPANTTANNLKIQFQIESGSAVTSFAPYSNICPISGHTQAVITRTGKNLYTMQITEQGVRSWTVDSDDYIRYNGITDGRTFTYANCQTFLKLSAGTYYIYGESTDAPVTGSGIRIINSDNIAIRTILLNGLSTINSNFTLSEDQTVGVHVKIVNEDASTPHNYRFVISTEPITTYEPYNGQTISVTFPSEAGTVYGGTVDVTNRVLTVDRAMVDLGTLNWAKEDPLTETQMPRFRSSGIANSVNPTVISSVNQYVVDAKCSKYFLSANPIYGRTENGSFCIATTNKMIYVIDNACDSAETFKTANSGTQLVYPLATPLTYQFTPQELTTLLGTNHVWADVGDTEVTLRIQAGDLAFLDALDYNSNKLINKPDIPSMLSTRATSIVESASGAIVTIEDGAEEAPVKNLTVGVEPVQDLHGYDSPWPAGGGKNLFIPNIQSGSKTNYSYTVNDDGTITVTVTTADANNILDIGTFHAAANVSYTISGCPTGGSLSGNRLYYAGAPASAYDKGSGASFTVTEDSDLNIRLGCGTVGTFTFKPMICLSSASEPTSFAPYSNICPITGHTGATVIRTGKNVWDEEWEPGAYNTTNGQKQTSSAGRIRSANYIPVKAGKQYLVIGKVDGILWYGKDKEYLGYTTNLTSLTAPNNAYFATFYSKTNYGSIYNNDISVNYPATDTQYHAYQGQTISVTFPSEAGTVYGGYVDVTNRVLTVDRTNVEINNNSTIYLSAEGYNPNIRGVFYFGLPSDKYGIYSGVDVIPNIIGNYIVTTSYNGIKSTTKFWMCTHTNVGKNVAWTAPYETVEDMKAYLASNPIQLVYSLATPITYQLTESEISDILSTLYGENHIWADSGDVTIEYRADTKTYIDNAIAKSQHATRSLITGIEASMTATQNYTTGALIIVGDDLYKATANIASGSTLTVGTNVSKITLAQYILEQLSA